MCQYKILLVCCALFISYSLSEPAEKVKAPANKMASNVFASKLNGFSFAFNDVISSSKDGNIVSSPFSIFAALAMLGVGANEKTRQQILHVLGWQDDDMVPLLETMEPLCRSIYSSSNGATVDVANKAWVGKQTNVLGSYQGNLTKYFGVDIGRADFLNNAESARQMINKWVEQKTAGKIPDLFSPGSLTKTTEMVVANAVYFKGAWREKFDPADTGKYDFFTDQQQSVQVDFMYRHSKIPTGFDEEHKIQLMKLPYAGDEFVMVFAIPLAEELDDGGLGFEDLDQLENKMANKQDTFDSWMKKLDIKNIQSDVSVYVPKFKIDLTLDLAAQLQRLGINDAFVAGGADFSGINGKSDLYVSSAVHKARIEVDEEGTVAAAATGMAMNSFSMPSEVFLNHPFLFYIVHQPSNAIIFQGKMKNPLN